MEKFYVEKTPYFDVKETLDSGQVFRFREEDGVFTLNASCHKAIIKDLDGRYEFTCDDADYFYNYFDLNTDYKEIQDSLKDENTLLDAVNYGKGIHILKQDTEEMIYSFLISQNNMIPRIKAIIERACVKMGEDMGGYFAFPKTEKWAEMSVDFYKSIGAGYRAEYLKRTGESLISVDLNEWKNLPTEELRGRLLSLHGVGRKVADCILLFGFNRLDVFPVDTWIKKVFRDEYPTLSPEKMSKTLVERYGDLSGYVQQWLFYYKRGQGGRKV